METNVIYANTGEGEAFDAVPFVRQSLADQVISAIDAILVGGNHLADELLKTADPAPYRDFDYWEVLGKHGGSYANVWAAWKSIMDARDGALAAYHAGVKS